MEKETKDNITTTEASNNLAINDNNEEYYTAKDWLNNINKEIVFFSKYEDNKELKNCTYNQGYISQEVYICNTCYKENNEQAGICIGCAFSCHKDHDVSQLYFKREFKCDCGNSKFSK